MRITKADKPTGFKKAVWVDGAKETNRKGESLSGSCSFCNRWSAELRDNLCRETDCVKGRELIALAQGTAGIAITGLPGNKELHTIQNESRVIVNPPKQINQASHKLTKAQRRKAKKLEESESLKLEQWRYKRAQQEVMKQAEYKRKLQSTFKVVDNKKIVAKQICNILGDSDPIVSIEESKVDNYWPVGNDKYISMACNNIEDYKAMPESVEYRKEVYTKIEFTDKYNQALYMLDHKLQNIREKQDQLAQAWRNEKQNRQ